jgi:ribosomal protein S18 acetylase RimI-like enzyme
LARSEVSSKVKTSSKTDIQIRMATPDDVSHIASVLRASFLEYRAAYSDDAFAATVPTKSQLKGRFEEGPIWVALCNGVIVGTVSAVPQDESLHIRSMAVLPTARGQEIGELLLKRIEDFSSAHDYKRLTLSTTPFLTRAIRLYERFGFRRSNEGPSDLFGTPLFTMAKSLAVLD